MRAGVVDRLQREAAGKGTELIYKESLPPAETEGAAPNPNMAVPSPGGPG